MFLHSVVILILEVLLSQLIRELYDSMMDEEYPMDYIIQEIEDKGAKQQEEILFQLILESRVCPLIEL
jgi:hypothetical protein